MAQDLDLWQGLRAQMILACSSVAPRPEVMIDWPSFELLSDLTNTGGYGASLISIFDMNMATPTTRWKTLRLSVEPDQCFTSTAASLNALAVGEIGTITLTANSMVSPFPTAPNLFDGVSCYIGYAMVQTGVVAVAGNGSTFNSLATQLAAAINSSTLPNFAGHLTASALDNVVTVKNTGSVPVSWGSAAGNNGTQIIELARENRPIQIACFSSSFDLRQQIAAQVKAQCAYLQHYYGLKFYDNTTARVLLNKNKYHRDYHNGDLWRFDQYLDCEQGVTNIDLLYSALVFQSTLTVS